MIWMIWLFDPYTKNDTSNLAASRSMDATTISNRGRAHPEADRVIIPCGRSVRERAKHMAAGLVVVDQADRLHVRVDDRRSDELAAARAERFRQRIGLGGARRRVAVGRRYADPRRAARTR